MSFDFFTEYKTWSDSDLRLVLQHPQQYRPEAVAAAEAILRERNVPLVVAVPHVEAPKEYDAENGSLLEPLLRKRAPFFYWPKTAWIRGLFLVAGLLYGWTIYQKGKGLLQPVLSGEGILEVNFFLEACFFCLLLLIVYLLARRESWGYHLFQFHNTYFLTTQSFYLYYYLFRLPIGSAENLGLLKLMWLLRIGLLSGFLRLPVAEWFGLGRKGRWMAPLIGLGAGVFVYLGFFVFY